MIKYKGKVFRNEQEMIIYLAEEMERLKNGITISYWVDSIEGIAPLMQLSNVGKYVVVGTSEKTLYLITKRANEELIAVPMGAYPATVEGQKGEQGDAGENGERGNGVFGCSDVLPSPTAYKEGDFYLLFNGELYKKVYGKWVRQTTLKGPQGVPGPEGGSDVIANPVEGYSRLLEKIKIDGSVYKIQLVEGVNGYTGDVVLRASDIKANDNNSIQANLGRIDDAVEDIESDIDRIDDAIDDIGDNFDNFVDLTSNQVITGEKIFKTIDGMENEVTLKFGIDNEGNPALMFDQDEYTFGTVAFNDYQSISGTDEGVVNIKGASMLDIFNPNNDDDYISINTSMHHIQANGRTITVPSVEMSDAGKTLIVDSDGEFRWRSKAQVVKMTFNASVGEDVDIDLEQYIGKMLVVKFTGNEWNRLVSFHGENAIVTRVTHSSLEIGAEHIFEYWIEYDTDNNKILFSFDADSIYDNILDSYGSYLFIYYDGKICTVSKDYEG